jgi:hypothetical protein
MFRGLAEAHLEALEPVLERHGLALVAEGPDGTMQLVGMVDPEEESTWRLVLAWQRPLALAWTPRPSRCASRH